MAPESREPDALELRLARLELTLLEVMTAVGMLVGELAQRDDLVLTTPEAVEEALEHGWQALVGVPAIEGAGVVVGERFASVGELEAAAPDALRTAVEETGAAVGALYAVENGEARLLASAGYPEGVMDAFARFPLSADLPAAVAARTRLPQWFETREEIVESYPHLLDAHEETEAALGERALQGAVVPILSREGTVAVAVVGFTEPDSRGVSRLEAVRSRLSAALAAR
jgi:hypothetical protein